MNTILEKEYDTVMKETVEPYLKKHRKSGYISSYDGIGKIHVMRYLAEEPKGVIVICHGYTESCLSAGALRTRVELSSDERSFSGTY